MRVLVLLLVSALVLAACGGQSKSEKAQKTVCDARADIGKQVNALKALTPATATVTGVRANVNAIQDDLRKIVDAQSTLSGDRRAQVKAATDQFTARVTDLVQQATRSLTLRDAATQLRAAVGDLATAYSQSIGKIDC
jgi:ABC-type glycerol-3-phosphate transport system substrate-binding protein